MRLLGRFAITSGENPGRIAHLNAPRRQLLLAYLALKSNHSATRAHIASFLWDEDSPDAARQSLRQALLELRRELAGLGTSVIHADRTTIALDGAIRTDVADFERLALSANPADHPRAVALYDGVLLEGVAGPNRASEDWLNAERDRLHLLAVPVFQKFATAVATTDADAVTAVRRLAAMDPLDEAAQRLLLRVLATRQSRDAALAEAERFTRTLRAELDAAPDTETNRLIAAIRDRTLTGLAIPRAPARPPSGPQSSGPKSSGPQSSGLQSSGASPSRPILRLPASPASWQPPARRTSSGIDRQALAAQGIYAVIVLPFASFPGPDEAADRHLAQVLTDDLIGDLSHTASLRVISRATSSLYGGKALDIAAIGAELGVHYAVEGSVRSTGDEVRINVSLIDVPSRLGVWSESITPSRAEYHAQQRVITRGLAYRLFSHVLADQAEQVPDAMADPAIEHDLALGWAAQIQIGKTGSGLDAGAHFGRVLARDPDNLAAMIGLGGFKAMQVITFIAEDPRAALEEAEPLLRRAIARNPHASIAHHYLGLVEKARGDAAASVASLHRAIDINPSFAPAYGALANMLGRDGDGDSGIENALYALRLSPRDPSAGIWWLFAGEIQLERGNDELAMDWVSRSVALNPRGPFGLGVLAALHALMGDKQAARAAATRLHDIAPSLTLDRMIERLMATSRPSHEPKRLIAGLREVFSQN